MQAFAFVETKENKKTSNGYFIEVGNKTPLLIDGQLMLSAFRDKLFDEGIPIITPVTADLL